MYTQCPECDTIFRVNAAVLRAAQGQVRCGVCDATFDAIRTLSDEIEAGVNAASASRIHYDPPPPPAPLPPVEGPVREPAENTHAEPFRPSPSLPLVAFEVAEASNEWWATPVTEWEPPAASDPADSAADEPSDTDEWTETVAHGPEEPLSAATEAVRIEPIEDSTPRGTLERITAFDAEIAPTIATEPDEREGPSRGPRSKPAGAMLAAVLALLILLTAQVVDHYRQQLATIPALTPTLTAGYSAFGRSLEPQWDISAYDIREWVADPDPQTKAIHLRAKILNRGPRPHPWPLLRVVFEDRYGALVARRDFSPTEYLTHPANDKGMIAPGARIDADLTLADPGPQVVGYEIDTCLPRASTIGCGSDYKGTHAE